MKKFKIRNFVLVIIALIIFNVAHEVFASCESCLKNGDDSACPASCKNTGQTLKLETTAPKKAPLPRLDDAEIEELSTGLAGELEDRTANKKSGISEVEFNKRVAEAKKFFNSPKVNNFLVKLDGNKENLLNKLRKNNCIDKNFEGAASTFIDKLVNRKIDEDSLAAGISSLFNEADIKKLSANIDNPPQELQGKIGLVAMQFVLNEAPELFQQFIKFSANPECIKKLKQERLE